MASPQLHTSLVPSVSSPMTHRARLVPALSALLLAAACADSPVAPSSPAAPDAASLAKRAPGSNNTSRSVATCTGATISLNADEARMLDLHTQERAANGLGSLCVSATLTSAARAHSQEMMSKGYFSHNSANGESFYTRLESFGYTGGSKGENIGWGSGMNGAPDQMFTMWKFSSGHYGNIVNPYFSEIGIGVSSGRYQGYSDVRMYTVDFGAP